MALDSNWRYTYMNKKAGEIFNCDPAKMIEKHIWTEFPEGIDQPFYKAYYRAMAEQQYIHVEEYYPPYDKWFENHIYPSPEGLSIFFRDITAKKKAEETLNQNRAFIESIINASPDIIYIYDIEERKNVYVNEGMQLNLGYSDNEIKQMGDQVIPLLMHPDDFDYYLNNTYPKYETLKDKEILTHEFRMKHKTGSWHWLFTKESVFLRKPGGTPKQIFGITADITEQKAAETALLESNFSLSEAQRISKTGNWTYYMNGDLKWSDNMYQLYGLASKITATTPDFFFQLVHPDDREKMQQWMQACLAGRSPGEYEFRSILPDGSIHYYSGSGEVKYDKENTPVYMRGTVQDITERKKAEEKLVKSEELFSGAFHASPAGILITRIADGKIIDANESFLKMFEFNREETIGHTSIELNMLSPVERAKLIQQQITAGGLKDFELLSKTKSGKPVNLLFSSEPLEINDEACHITTLIDITGRKKAEEKIIGSEKLYRNLFENMYHGFAYCKGIIEKGKVVDFIYITVNTEHEKIFKVENINGKKLSEVLPEALISDPSYAQLLEEVVLRGKTIRFETKYQPLDIWLSATLYNTGNQNFVLLTENITERKKAEEEIKSSNEKLRQLSAHLQTIREEERKRIGREIHDELGQQLTAIKMDVAWIDKKIPKESDIIKAKLNNILSLLNGSNQSVRKILNELRPAILDNQDLPDALEWHGRQFTNSTGVPVQFLSGVISNRLPEPITTCIFRVYQEALTNIARYAKAQKVLTSLNSTEDSIQLIVEDDGQGFDTAATGEKRSFGLLGMKERVFSLNGTFELVSAKGKGTKIVVSIPYNT